MKIDKEMRSQGIVFGHIFLIVGVLLAVAPNNQPGSSWLGGLILIGSALMFGMALFSELS